MKFGMQAGDFLLSTNILLPGNNYGKVSLLFKFMNMGMVNKNTYCTIQDTYCVDAVKEYWEEKNSEAICRLQGRDVVVLGVYFNILNGACVNGICLYNICPFFLQGMAEMIHQDIVPSTAATLQWSLTPRKSFM